MQFTRYKTNRNRPYGFVYKQMTLDRTRPDLIQTGQPLVNGMAAFPFERWDCKPFQYKFMQDAIIDKSDISYKCGQFGTEGTFFVAKSIGFDQFIEVDCRNFCDTLNVGQTHLSQAQLIASSRLLYDRVLEKPITKRVVCDRNPFDTDFSIWYLVVDLIQLPKLAVSLLSKSALLKSIKSQATLKDLANDHLAIQFGLLPTIADLKEFLAILTKWGRKYQDLDSTFEEGFRVFNEPLILTQPREWRVEAYSDIFGFRIPATIKLKEEGIKLLCAARYYFVCPELTGVLNRIRQFVDQAGLLDPAALWDVVPWSFVIDWFFDVGPWIHKNLKPQLFPADMVLADWCESIGQRTRVEVIAHIEEPDLTGPFLPDRPNDITVAVGYLKQYARKRQFPATLIVDKHKMEAKDSIVSIRRTLIGTALIQQKTSAQGKRDSSQYRRRHSAAFSKKWGHRR